jgi:hypothetical protein
VERCCAFLNRDLPASFHIDRDDWESVPTEKRAAELFLMLARKGQDVTSETF